MKTLLGWGLEGHWARRPGCSSLAEARTGCCLGGKLRRGRPHSPLQGGLRARPIGLRDKFQAPLVQVSLAAGPSHFCSEPSPLPLAGLPSFISIPSACELTRPTPCTEVQALTSLFWLLAGVHISGLRPRGYELPWQTPGSHNYNSQLQPYVRYRKHRAQSHGHHSHWKGPSGLGLGSAPRGQLGSFRHLKRKQLSGQGNIRTGRQERPPICSSEGSRASLPPLLPVPSRPSSSSLPPTPLPFQLPASQV